MALKKKEKRGEAPVVNTVVEDGEVFGELAQPVAPEPRPEPPKEKRPEKRPEQPRQGLLRVTARQFSQARGIRWERAAGFLHWATTKYGAKHLLTVPEWTKVHEEFLKLPVGR